jgi:archaellum component FlaG (FlaF/FlaG flagellin family)
MFARSTAAIVLALLSGSAAADMTDSAERLEFYAPETSWRIAIPRQDWEVMQEKRKPDGGGYYYFVGSKAKGLQFSIYFDKTRGCTSGETCRAAFWRNGKPGPMFNDPQAVRQYERNGFHVVEFYVENVGGYPIKQANVSAHMYRDGYWVDVRVTKVGREAPDPAPLVAVIESISVK